MLYNNKNHKYTQISFSKKDYDLNAKRVALTMIRKLLLWLDMTIFIFILCLEPFKC